MLNEEDQKKLSEAFEPVKKILIATSGSVDAAYQSLSYLTDVYLEYDPEKSTDFNRWAAARCKLRYKDQKRKEIGPTRYNNLFKMIKLSNEIENDKLENPYSDEVFQKEKALYKIRNSGHHYKKFSIDDVNEIELTGLNDPAKKAEWNEIKKHIIEMAHSEFPNVPDSTAQNKRNNVFRAVIIDYLLEKCEKNSKATIESVSKRLGVSVSTFSAIKKSKRMKQFFEDAMDLDNESVFI